MSALLSDYGGVRTQARDAIMADTQTFVSQILQMQRGEDPKEEDERGVTRDMLRQASEGLGGMLGK